jgi:3-hydroxyisobutyrate dehydrogenase-like beta-hydroxyacid dehydrogenase
VKVGFIGAGRMGRPMVDRLVSAGHEVAVLVRRPEARAAAEADGLTGAATVAATVDDADVVFVVVLNDDQVRSVCLGSDGALAAMKPGATLVQHTTCDPATVQLIAAAGSEKGIRVLDAALSGGPPSIAAGQLTLWVGGDEAVLEEMRPLLETYASPIMWVGPIGHGQRVKLVNNALFVAQVGLAVDAVRMAGSLGIDEQAILAAVQHGSGASFGLSVVAGAGSVDAVGDRLADLMRKDVNVVRDVARRTETDLGIIGTVLSSAAVEQKVLQSASEPDRPS